MALCENYVSHLSLWSELRELNIFYGRRKQLLVTENDVNKLSLSVAAHWAPRSVRLHCSDSLCLHDYWKVSLLHGASRITSSCSGPCSLFYTNVLTNYAVIVSRLSIKIWHWRALWKHWIGVQGKEAKTCKNQKTAFHPTNSQNTTLCFSLTTYNPLAFKTGIASLHLASETSFFFIIQVFLLQEYFNNWALEAQKRAGV